MAIYKNVASQKIAVFAWDTVNDVPKTGDAANITAEISLDGGTSAATNDVNPTELDATDHPGIYIFDLTQAETNADMVLISPVSGTADIVLEPLMILTLPGTNAALTANVTQLGGDAQSATDLKHFADSGYDPATSKVQGVVLVDTTTTNTDMRGTDGANTTAPDNASIAAILLDTGTDGVVVAAASKTGYSLTATTGLGNQTANITGNLSGSVGSVTGAINTAAGVITTLDGLDTAQDTQHATTQSNQATLLNRLTASRAGYLDNINIGGAVASQADINAINQSASRRSILTMLALWERPESGNFTKTIEVRTWDGDGAPANADSTPTIAVTGTTSGDLSANLSVASNPSTGVYRWTYTGSSASVLEDIRVDVTPTIGAVTYPVAAFAQVVEFVSATWTSADQTKLVAIYDKLPSTAYLLGTASSDGSGYATPTNVSDAQTAIITQVDANEVKIDSVVSDLANGTDGLGALLTAINTRQATVANLANVVTMASKFDTMIVLDGLVWDFTAAALAATHVVGGDATEAKQDIIIADIAELMVELESHDTGAGNGARTITVSVTDGTDPLENVKVRFSEGITTRIANTLASGERDFGLDDATWSYSITKDGYVSVTGAHIVDINETPLSVILTPVVSSAPSDPALCKVSLNLYKNGTPVQGATFEARFVDNNQAVDNVVLSKQVDEDTTDVNGYAELDLVRLDQFTEGNGLYQIRVVHPDTSVSLDIKTTIPNQSNVDVQDLI